MWSERRNALIFKPGNLLTVRDYSERLSAHFDWETKYDHFGNGKSLSIEGYSVEVAMNNSTSCLEFHSHFFDDRRQDASTTNTHMIKILDNMRQNNQDVSECTIWESTDWRSKQYRCGAALYFLSYVSAKYNIIVDQMIGAPGHGKDIVDSINVCDKRYLKGKMCMIGTLEADNYSKKVKHTQWLTMHITVLQKSTRGYVNVVKERMDQRVIVSTKCVKLNAR